MRIICFIDYLCQGGAQRQLTTLALFLKEMGHTVSFLTYHEHDFFLPVLKEARIEVNCLRSENKLRRILGIRDALRAAKPNAVLAFLEGPCFYAELAGFPVRDWGLVVSERLQITPRKLVPDWKRFCHRLADYVTANSHANRLLLEAMQPSLTGKIATIYNCLDLSLFKPDESAPRNQSAVRLVVAASYQERKNAIGLIKAVSLARRKTPQVRITVDWYGGIPFYLNGAPDKRYLEEAQKTIAEMGLTEDFRLHPAERDIIPQFQAADAVVLPSFLEGLPNTICEGMACGCPILASNIGDADILVQEGQNGFLFDPSSIESMAQAITSLAQSPMVTRLAMGRESRRRAETLFSPSRVARSYETLLLAAAEKRKRSI